jgi:hypothetical protein
VRAGVVTLSALKLFALRVSTVNVSVVTLSALKLPAAKASTVNVSALKLPPIKLSTVKVSTVNVPALAVFVVRVVVVRDVVEMEVDCIESEVRTPSSYRSPTADPTFPIETYRYR